MGENTFPLENPYSNLNFNFYCGNGGIKHHITISLENSNLLSSIIESGQISNQELAKQDIYKFDNSEDEKRPFPYRYQIYNAKECNNNYFIIFDIFEYRGYYGCTIYAVLQIESKINH